MKKLYRKGAVHPSPPAVSDHLLSFLPAAILTLTLVLSPQEKEVLAYLISCSSSATFSHKKGGGGGSPAAAKSGADHPASFSCSCFRCYMSYWVKWDSSPNRERIHEIIDAYEESFVREKEDKSNSNNKKKEKKSKKERRKGKSVKEDVVCESTSSELSLTEKVVAGLPEPVALEVDEEVVVEEEEEEMEKGGSVRRLVGFLGERIWSVWG